MSLLYRTFGLLVGVFTNAILAQSLGVAQFGQFGVGLTILTVITQLSDFGAVQAMTAEARRNPLTAPSVAGSGICIRLVTSLVGVAVAIPVGLLAIPNADTIVLVILAACAPLGASGVLIALSNAKLRPEIGSALTLGQSALWLIAVVTVAMSARPVALTFAIAFAITTVIQTAITFAFYGRRSMIGRPTWPTVRLILQTSWPVGLLGLLVTSYYRLGGVLVIGLAGAHEAGLYTAAYKIIDVAQIIPSLIVVPMLPVLIDALAKSAEQLRQMASAVIRLALLVALLAGLAIAVFSGVVVEVVYGRSFEGAAQVLEVLGIAFVGITLGYVGSTICFATGRVKRQIPFVAALGAISLCLQPWAIANWGALGSAYVAAVTEIAMCILSLTLCSRPLQIKASLLLGWQYPIFIASITTVYAVTRHDLVLNVAACAIVFSAGVILLRLMGKGETGLLLRRKSA